LEASILDALPVAVVGLRERRVIFANRAVETVFGWKPEELIGKTPASSIERRGIRGDRQALLPCA